MDEQPIDRYHANLLDAINRPLAGLPATLAELYQPPRALLGDTVVDLEADLKNWLEHPVADDALRLLHAPAGTGKTTFARVFAARHQGHRRVLLVELPALSPEPDLVAGLERYLAGHGWEGPNPLDPELTEPPCLLLLDGLDEMAGAPEGLIAGVNELLSAANLRGVRLQALVTGSRPELLPGTCGWQLLPFAADRQDFDLRRAWWQALLAKTELAADGILSQLDQAPWRELSALPLGSLLLARSVLAHGKLATPHRSQDGLWQEWVEQALAGVHADERKGIHRAIEESALDAWQHGWLLFPRGNKPTPDGLAGLHDTGRADQRESLLHVGLRDHLVSRRLIRAIGRTGRELDYGRRSGEGGWLPEQALLYWVGLMGAAPLSDGIATALGQALTQAGRERAAEWQAVLLPLVNRMLRDGLPVDRVFPRPSFAAETALAANARLNLFVLLQACARAAATVSAVEWPGEGALANLIRGVPRDSAAVLRSSLAWLDCHGQHLAYLELSQADFSHSTLNAVTISDCDLRGSSFAQTDLEQATWSACRADSADLGQARLSQAVFVGVKLTNVPLRGADLRGIRLVDVALAGVDLDHVNLQGADVSGVNFAGASLRSANLADARLRGANLANTQLQNADFTGADLSETDLREANCKGTRFTRAKLDGANVQGAQLRKADVRGTVLDRHFG